MAPTEPTLVPEDDPDTVKFLGMILKRMEELAPRFDTIQAIVGKPNSWEVADASASGSFQIAHFLNYCLLAATDCCRAVVELVLREDGMLLPVVALHPIMRSAIESASMAAWILGGAGRRERVLRRLQAAFDEMAHERALVESAVVGTSKSEEQKAIRQNVLATKKQQARMRAVADANGIDPTEYEGRFPGWESIVRQAGAGIGIENDRLVTMWRFASGLSHPSLRRGVLALEFAQDAEEGDVLSGVLSAKSEWVAYEMALTERLVSTTLRAWSQSKLIPNAEFPVPIPLHLNFDRRGKVI